MAAPQSALQTPLAAEGSLAAPARSRRQTLRAQLTAYGFLAPAGCLVILFFFIPMLLILFLSITNLSTTNFTTDVVGMLRSDIDLDLGSFSIVVDEPKYIVGLANFERMFADEFAPKILFNTLFYVFCTLIFFNVGLALVISLLTAHINRRAGFFFRAVILPRITSRRCT